MTQTKELKPEYSLSGWIEALHIFLKSSGDTQFPFCAEHDIIYTGHTCPPDKIEPVDLARLKELGWTWDADLPAWSKYT